MTAPASSPTILEAMDKLWPAWFRDPATWAPWRAFLSALFGLRMTAKQRALYRRCTDRDEIPAGGFVEAWLAVGRRGGKSMVLALIAVYLAVFRDWRPYLSPGEVGTIKIIAVDRRQARVIHRYCRALIAEVPALAALLLRDTEDQIVLSNSITIEVQTATFRSVRGYTLIAALADEIAFWRSDDSANPDEEILAALRPAMATVPGAMLLAASSPYARRGVLWNAHQRHFGRPGPVLVWQAATRTMNPTVPQAVVDEAMERDPASAAAEYLAEFRTDLSDFLDRELVAAAVDASVIVRPPRPGIAYVAFADPSGGRGDAFAVAIAHAEGDVAVLDCLHERRAPFDPSSVIAEVAALLRSYGLAEVTGDRYAAEWTIEGFAAAGIRYRQSERDRSAIYIDALPLFTTGRARLLDNARLVHQFAALERHVTRLGKDRVGHPVGGADDLAVTTGGVLCLVAREAGPALWHRADLLQADRGLTWPVICDAVFATAGIDQRGVFVCYWASGAERFGGPRSLLIDYEQSSLTPTLFAAVVARVVELTAQTRPGAAAMGIVTVSALAPHCVTAGLPLVADGDELLAAREALLLIAATEIGLGEVKVSNLAEARSLILPLPLGELRSDAPRSAAGDAALLGVAGTLPAEMQPAAWSRAA